MPLPLLGISANPLALDSSVAELPVGVFCMMQAGSDDLSMVLGGAGCYTLSCHL